LIAQKGNPADISLCFWMKRLPGMLDS